MQGITCSEEKLEGLEELPCKTHKGSCHHYDTSMSISSEISLLMQSRGQK
jgi:hypothetical protein